MNDFNRIFTNDFHFHSYNGTLMGHVLKYPQRLCTPKYSTSLHCQILECYYKKWSLDESDCMNFGFP